MGTISDKLLYLNETKDELRDGINDLVRASNEIDEDDTFRSYVEPLKSIRDRLPRVEGEGENITLDDTIEARIRKTLNGNTSQVQYSGNQLLDFNNPTSYGTGCTYTFQNDILTFSSPSSSGNYPSTTFIITDLYKNNANKVVKFVYDAIDLSQYGKNNAIQLNVQYNDSTPTSYIGLISSSGVISEHTIPSDTSNVSVVRLNIYSNNSTTAGDYSISITKPMLQFGSEAKTYEPYCGGIPSPNSDYPQEIHSVSGDNDINICGKNLLVYPYQDLTKTDYISWTVNTDGTILVDGSNTSGTTKYFYLQWYTSPGIYLKAGTYTLSIGSSSSIRANVNNWFTREIIASISVNTSSTTFTLAEDTTVALILAINNNASVDNIIISPQLELNSSATTFEKYQSQTYPINLPSGMELNKIGTYQDYFYKNIPSASDYSSDRELNAWYLKKEIGKREYAIADMNNSYNYPGWKGENVVPLYEDLGSRNLGGILTDYTDYMYNINAQNVGLSVNFNAPTNPILFLNRVTYGNEYTQTYWQTNYPNLIITMYYGLYNPTYTEITDTTLISQLDAVWYSQDGQTNISQENNDQPFWLEVNALKDSEWFH